MEIFSKITRRFKWSYAGSCESQTIITRGGVATGVTYSQHYMLMVRGDGKRKVVKTGDKYANSSVYGRRVEAEVQAWLLGGPFPKSGSIEEKKEGKLIVFNGGKK